MKTALVFGSTGLVGSELIKQLCNHPGFEKIIVYNRKNHTLPCKKVEEQIIDYNDIDSITNNFSGDVVFCCLGTTIKKAKTKENFRTVDLEYPLMIGRLIKTKNIPKYIVISSVGADPKSSFFYLATKGQMEQSILELNIANQHFVRPSTLMGKRSEFRFGEFIGGPLTNFFSVFMAGKLKKYKPIHANKVANAMIKIALSENSKVFFESNELQELSKSL